MNLSYFIIPNVPLVTWVRLGVLLQMHTALNSLWPSDAIWHQISLSTLVQVMACCLTAPSHYLNQCWLILSKVQRHSSVGNFTIDTSAISHWNYLENYISKISFKSPRGQWVKITGMAALVPLHCQPIWPHLGLMVLLATHWSLNKLANTLKPE